MDDLVSMLDREVSVLVKRLRGFTAGRWRAAAPPYERRADAVFHLARRLAELAEAPVALPWVGDHALADQIAVTGHDLVGRRPSDRVVETALAEIEETRRLLGI